MKTRGRRLTSDGEKPGIWTERAWADERHPQRFVNVPPPDGLSYRPGPPPPPAIGAKVDLSWVMASDTSYAATDGTTPRDLNAVAAALGVDPSAFFADSVTKALSAKRAA